MLVSLGTTEAHAQDLLGLLGACHTRIRRFARLAYDVGDRLELKALEVRDAVVRCERYFVEALPLHVRDEEDSLVPRLRGLDPVVDAALAEMSAQHVAHGPVLAELLDACRAVHEAPEAALHRVRLARVARALGAEFEAHLALEESVIFPAIDRLLAPAARDEVVAELRARRRQEESE